MYAAYEVSKGESLPIALAWEWFGRLGPVAERLGFSPAERLRMFGRLADEVSAQAGPDKRLYRITMQS